MGAGNPLVRSYDGDCINPVTFFYNPKLWDVDEFIAEYAANNDGTELSIQDAYEEMSDQDYESFLELFHVEGLSVHGWDGERDAELSAEFRGDGIIIASGEKVNVVVPSGSEHHHIGFGFVPNRSYNSFWEEAWDDNIEKQAWYGRYSYDFDARIKCIANNKHHHYIRQCNGEIRRIAALIAKEFGNDYFKDTIRVRNGAWTSSTINKTEFKSLALI